VGGDKLLLLTDGIQEAERVHAEAEHADERDRQQRAACGERDAKALSHL
jgi:hypothetical protein